MTLPNCKLYLLNALPKLHCEITLQAYSQRNFCYTVGTINFPMSDVLERLSEGRVSISLEPSTYLSKIMLFKKS